MAFLMRTVRVLLSGGLLVATAHVQTVYGQTAPGAIDSRPTFDVASVKANNSGTGVDRIKNSGGLLLIENVSLKRLICMAFDVSESQDYLLSGPDWMNSENLDIQARFPPDTPNSKFLLMFQRLLEERFKMVSHREPRQFSVIALVRGNGKKGAPGIHPAAAPGGAYRFKAVGGHATGFSISMAMLAGRLSRPDFGLDHPVLDLTGLEGTFDVTLDWKPEHVQEGAQAPEGESDASIFVAIEEQLGLRLEPRKMWLEVLVIDQMNNVPVEN